MKRAFTALAAVLILGWAGPAPAATNTIAALSPASASPGASNLLVTFTLPTQPPPPSTNVAPTGVSIGTNAGSAVTHAGQYLVAARFNFSPAEPAGPRDAAIHFPGPSGGVYYVKSAAFTVQSTQVVYVAAANTNGPWTGQSWATAFRGLQEALSGALGAVWVAQGTYLPATNAGRTASFRLQPGLALYGGFAGGETSLGQRDWTAHPTVLSGELGAAGGNAYHVVVGADNAVLDGFVVTGGRADGRAYNGFGGGLVNYNGASVSVLHCVFRGNRAREGGAMYNYNDSLPLVAHCTFATNTADKGGAIVNRDGSNSTITDCVFAANSAAWRGGAVFNDYGASPSLVGCAFTNNSTPGHGGAIYTDDTASQIGFTSPAVSNCTFAGNAAGFRGGAIANYNKCTPAIRNCTFTGNSAGTGGGAIANDYGVSATLSGNAYSGNAGGSGQADVDTDATSQVQ